MKPSIKTLAVGLALLVPVQAPSAFNPACAAEAPFDPSLQRLAEILGSLQFLSALCGGRQESWRAEMEKLLDAEKPDAERRQKLIASFNRGYKAFATYRTCTPSASAAIALYRREGAALTRDLTGRFGN